MAYGGVNLPNVSIPEFVEVKEIAISADGIASETARIVRAMQAQMEDIEPNKLAITETMRAMRGVTERTEAHEMIVLTANLTNSEIYPFNNSKTTLAFNENQTRSTKDYSVTFFVEESTGGPVGDIIVSDKMINGFKVEYTGSATAAAIKCFVLGGR